MRVRSPTTGFDSCKPMLTICTGKQDRAHHFQAGHDGTKQVREGSSRQGENQRRVKSYPTQLYKHHQYNTFFSLGPPFPHLVLFGVCSIYHLESKRGARSVKQLLVLPVYRNLEAFFSFAYSYPRVSLLCGGVKLAAYRLQLVSLQSTGSSLSLSLEKRTPRNPIHSHVRWRDLVKITKKIPRYDLHDMS
jgi:hypothetical protein